MKKLLYATCGILLYVPLAHADPLVWKTSYGTIGLPFESTEMLVGYGAIAKQAVGGISLPVYSDPKNIITLQLGAVAPWPVQGTAVQPYFAAGHDILREIPILSQYQSAHLNIFARYISNATPTKADVGISFSYAPIQAVLANPTTPAPSVPPTSKLNLFYGGARG